MTNVNTVQKRRWIVPVGDAGRVELNIFGSDGDVSFSVTDCGSGPDEDFIVVLTTHEREELILALQAVGQTPA